MASLLAGCAGMSAASAAVFFSSGIARYKAGWHREAATDLTRIFPARKDDKASLRYRAYSYYSLEAYGLSIADSSRFTETYPENARNGLPKSAAYGPKGEYDRAMEARDGLPHISPPYAYSYHYHNRGFGYSRGNYEKRGHSGRQTESRLPEQPVA